MCDEPVHGRVSPEVSRSDARSADVLSCNREDFAFARDRDFRLIQLVKLLFTGIAAQSTTNLLCSASG